MLNVVNHLSEGDICWREEVKALKERGVIPIDLVATCATFLLVAHQLRVVHLKRQILNCVSYKDKPQLTEELNDVFALENKEMESLLRYEQFITFIAKWEKKHPILRKYKVERNIAYFAHVGSPVWARKYIYTINWTERLNRKYKRTIKMKTSMPSNKTVLFLLTSVAMEETKTIYAKKNINRSSGNKGKKNE